MTQLAPTTVYYAQAVSLMKEIELDYARGKLKTIDDIQQRIAQAFSLFNQNIGKPLVTFEPIVPGEPPLSEKMNRFFLRLEQDLNICQQQTEFLQAAAIHLHNYVKTEILKAQTLNAQAANKLKTLQLYSNAHDSNLIRFGDFFKNTDFIDLQATLETQRATLQSPGMMTLKRETRKIITNKDGLKVKILNTSNGFLGNNQEINDPSQAITDPVSGAKEYTFVAQSNRRAELKDTVDQKPTTWIEYEKYLVSDADRQAAKNFNFTYLDTSKLDEDADVTESVKVDWSNGPSDGMLKLDVEFDLGQSRTINGFTFTPFGLESNKNYAVKVKYIETSPDGTDWAPLNPENVWIAVEANLQTAAVSSDVSIGSASWSFSDRAVKYIRMHLEQPHSIDANIGHLYYETKSRVIRETTRDDEGNLVVTETLAGGERVEGPIPPLEKPHKYYGTNNRIVNGLVQKVEYFRGKRWVIGIRDCTIDESKYANTSVIVSKPFRIDGVVDRVAIESDIEIPSSYDSDNAWIRFYVSPNNGLTWYPISRIQDDFLGIPEVIAFNDPLPVEFREQGVTYHQVNSVVNSLRVKIELSRPSNQPSTTPVVKNYTLKIRKR